MTNCNDIYKVSTNVLKEGCTVMTYANNLCEEHGKWEIHYDDLH